MKEKREMNTPKEINKNQKRILIIIFVVIVLGLAYDLLFIN